jgi:nucleoid DNA-binding protein
MWKNFVEELKRGDSATAGAYPLLAEFGHVKVDRHNRNGRSISTGAIIQLFHCRKYGGKFSPKSKLRYKLKQEDAFQLFLLHQHPHSIPYPSSISQQTVL